MKQNLPGNLRKIFKPRNIVFGITILLILLFLLIAQKYKISIDEINSLETTSIPLGRVYHQAMDFENQAPLYFLSLKLWRFIDGSVFHAQLLSLIFSIAGLITLYKLLSLFVPQRTAAFLSLLFVLNPFFLTSSFIIRNISFTIFLSLLLLYSFFKVFYNDKKGPVPFVLFSLLSAFALYSHYYLGFLLLSLGITLLIQRKFSAFISFILCMFFPLISLIPIILDIQKQTNTYADYVFGTPSIKEYIIFLTSRLENFITDYKWLGLSRTYRFAMRVFLIVAFLFPILFFLFKNFKNLNEKNKSMLIIFVLLLFFFSSLFVIFNWDFVMPRHVIPLFVLLILVVMLFSNESHKKTSKISLYFLFLIIYLVSFLNINKFNVHNGYKDAAGYLAENYDKNDIIIAYPEAVGRVLKYYSPQNFPAIEMMPLTHDYRESYNINKWIFHSKSEAIPQILDKTRNAPKIFLLTPPWLTELHGIDFNIEMVDQIFDSLFVKKNTFSYHGDIVIQQYINNKEAY